MVGDANTGCPAYSTAWKGGGRRGMAALAGHGNLDGQNPMGRL